MTDKDALSEAITAKYKLKRVSYTDLVAWPFADYAFGTDWDVISDVTKSRLYGFNDVVNSEAMFVRLLRRFREERIVPSVAKINGRSAPNVDRRLTEKARRNKLSACG